VLLCVRIARPLKLCYRLEFSGESCDEASGSLRLGIPVNQAGELVCRNTSGTAGGLHFAIYPFELYSRCTFILWSGTALATRNNLRSHILFILVRFKSKDQCPTKLRSISVLHRTLPDHNDNAILPPPRSRSRLNRSDERITWPAF